MLHYNLFSFICAPNSNTPTCYARTRGLQTNKTALENLTHHAEVSEKEIEKYLVKRAGEHGWPCLKYSNPNMVGYPDRLIVLPDGQVAWVEVKSRDKKPRKIQRVRHDRLREMGHVVWVIDSRSGVDDLFKFLEL